MADRRPVVFIGSSVEGLGVAEGLQARLDYFCESVVWDQGVFGAGRGSLENLLRQLRKSDFAILVVDAHDTAIVRGEEKKLPRDNVIFELGLFMGHLGPDRTFMVFNRAQPPNLPTDLAGITPADYQPHNSGNLEPALGAAATRIKQAINEVLKDFGRHQEAEPYESLQLLTRDESSARLGSLNQRIANAQKELCFSGNDCKAVVETASPHVEEALKERGVHIKILCVNPANRALTKMLSMIDPRFATAQQFEESMVSVAARLEDFRTRHPELFQYKYLDFLPALGFFISDPENDGILKVETYTAKPFVPNTRPHMVVRPNSKWRPYYLQCWQNYWNAATDPNESSIN
jgi:Ni,Fe-hydrogenase maturation factor